MNRHFICWSDAGGHHLESSSSYDRDAALEAARRRAAAVGAPVTVLGPDRSVVAVVGEDVVPPAEDAPEPSRAALRFRAGGEIP